MLARIASRILHTLSTSAILLLVLSLFAPYKSAHAQGAAPRFEPGACPFQVPMLFKGSPAELTALVQDKTWLVKASSEQAVNFADQGMQVVSSVQTPEGAQYRILGKPAGELQAQPAMPTLEDGYIWLMQSSRR